MVGDAPGHTIPGLRMLRIPVRPAWLGVIGAGGAAGTATRAWLEGLFPASAGQWPWTTFWINVSGALLLGVLLEVLAETGPDRGWRRGVRLGAGTGFMGGYTTYSSFAVETFVLVDSGAWLVGLGYAVGSVVLGLLAAFAGARVVRRLFRRHRRAQGAIR